MNQYTKGEWKAAENGLEWIRAERPQQTGITIAKVINTAISNEEFRANAHLIAARPCSL